MIGMRVYIVIINYNGARDTIECIKSLLKINYSDYRVVIVDNNSNINDYNLLKNNLVEICKEKEKKLISLSAKDEIISNFDILLVSSSVNKGFSGGNNIGVKYALKDEKCEAVWFLNNDTVVDCYALTSMMDKIELQDNIGVIGSILLEYNNPKKIQCVGGRYNLFMQKYLPVLAGKEIEKISLKENDFFNVGISGASFLVRKSTIVDLKLFDEAYFLYCEELDISARCRRSNWKMAMDVDSLVHHKGSSSIGRKRSSFKEYHAVRSKTIYMKKYYPLLFVIHFSIYVICRSLFRLLFNRDILCCRSAIKGYIDGVKAK